MSKITKSYTIGRYEYTLTVDNDNLIATLTRPAKSMIGIHYELNHSFLDKEYMEKTILETIERLQKREKAIAERKRQPRKQTAGQAVKAELKKAFPGVKFSCTTESYSMGSSLNVSWTDGPTTKQVEKYLNKYKYGKYNSMEEYYEYTNTREDIPQVKYVLANRSMSDQTRKTIIDRVDKVFHDIPEYDKSHKVYQMFESQDIKAGESLQEIQRKKTDEKQLDFYQNFVFLTA